MDAGQGGGEKYSNPNLHFEVSGGWDESASDHAVATGTGSGLASLSAGPGSPSISGGTVPVSTAASGVGGDDDDACEQVSSQCHGASDLHCRPGRALTP